MELKLFFDYYVESFDGCTYYTISGAAKLINTALSGVITHESESGSIYSTIEHCGVYKTIRVSDHYVYSMDPYQFTEHKRTDHNVLANTKFGFTEKYINSVIDDIKSEIEWEIQG